MQQYILRRVLLLIPTLIGITFIVYSSVRFLPGDVVSALAGENTVATPEFRAAIEERLGLTTGVFEGYVQWLWGVVRLDLGDSFLRFYPVANTLQDRIIPTVELGFMAIAVAIIIAIPVGIISAIRQDTATDYVSRTVAIAMLATPTFWQAILIITFGFLWFGYVPPLKYANIWDDPWANIQVLGIPAIILGTNLTGSIMRLTRSTMLEVLRQDYVRTAWAKGLRERSVIIRHVVRNAMIPVITIIGTLVPVVVGGTVILESIFSIPGMGSWFIDGVNNRDYPVVQAVVLLSALVVVFRNLIVDLLYSVIDPRIRLG
jgi:peptide/nickel transport system permease protein